MKTIISVSIPEKIAQYIREAKDDKQVGYYMTNELTVATDFKDAETAQKVINRLVSAGISYPMEVKQVQVPSVSYGNKEVGFTHYQLAAAKFHLSLMANGMKGRYRVKDFKDTFNLKGNTAVKCLEEIKVMMNEYKSENTPQNPVTN